MGPETHVLTSPSVSTTDVGDRQPRPALRSWPQDAFRIAFGLIWLIDAVLKWLPGFRSTYVSAITGVAKGQPGWLKWWFDFWVKLQTPRPTFFAYLVAVLETLVALAIIFGFARKITYISSAVFGVVIWAVAEGFGGPYMVGSSDIGTAIIYAVVSMGLLDALLLRRHQPLQRRLLHREADLVVVEGSRGRSPGSHRTHSLRGDPDGRPAGRSRIGRLGERQAYAARDAMNHGAMTSSPALPCRVRFRSGVWRHQWSPVLARNVKGRGRAAGRSTPTNQMMGAMDQQPRHPTNEG